MIHIKHPYRIAALVLFCLAFLGVPAVNGQGGGGNYTLTWGGASGSAGSSKGGSFEVSGTAGQPQTEQLQGGSYGLTGGYEQPVCPAGAAQAVEVTMELSGVDVTLTWVDNSANGAYDVHRSATPFFTPGSTTLVKTVFPPDNSYPDKGGAGSPGQNSFYIVRAKCGALWDDSGRTGAFSFQLTPGN